MVSRFQSIGENGRCAVLVALALLLTSSVAAQTIRLNEDELPTVDPFGNVRLHGRAINLPIGSESDYQPLVQGIVVNVLSIGAGTLTFDVDVPVTPPGPLLAFPYRAFWANDNHFTLPILAELVQVSTNTVVDRRKKFLWDRRADANKTKLHAGHDLTETLGTQITTRGIDRLEPTFLPMLPAPSRHDFNSVLSDWYNDRARSQKYQTNTNYYSGAKTCFPMQDVESLFGTAAEYITVRAVAASAQYVAYGLAKAAGAPTAPFCVKTPDYMAAKHWEVCVGRLDGALSDVNLTGGATGVDLTPDGQNNLTAAVTLGAVRQTVDISLRDVSIRWADNPLCAMRSAVTTGVADSTMTGDAARNDWATCRGANARATSAHTVGPITLPFVGSTDPERVDVQDIAPATFVIEPASRTPHAAGAGTCGDPVLLNSATSLLEQYYTPLERALGRAWLDQSPNSAFASAMDTLMTTVEHGTFDAPLDHTITSTFNFHRPDEDGIVFKHATNADIKPEFVAGPAQPTFVRPKAVDVPWSDDGYSPHLTPFRFDVSFSTTTGALNQVLRELFATARLNVILAATDGAALSQAISAVNPAALAALNSPTVQWRVSPVEAPFTWMADDPPYIPGEYHVAYHLNDLRVDAVEPGVNGAPDMYLLRLRLDYLDSDFNLGFSSAFGSDYLAPVSSAGSLLAATVVESHFAGCPMVPHTLGFLITCDRGVEVAATLVLRPWTQGVMTSLLSDYPGPQYFDAQGRTTVPVQLTSAGRYKFGNRITVYGNIR